MYFKIEKGTETFGKIDSVWKKMNEVNNQSKKWAAKNGFEKFGISHRGVAGGISCVEYPVKPDGYKTVGKKYDNLYFPKASNKTLLEEINKLPIVTIEEYNEAIGFKSHFKGLTHYRAYGSKKAGDLYLVEISDNCDFTPPFGMIEILNSEYKALEK